MYPEINEVSMSQFTDTYIKGLKAKSKRYEEYEGGGFGIRVTPKGVKSWIYRYKIDGKTDRLTLGHYPTMPLSLARTRFIELSQLRRENQKPKDVIQEQKEQVHNTVKKLLLDWYEGYIVKHRKQPLQIKQQIEADIIPLLGEKELESLLPKDITRALDKIVHRGSPVQANKILSTLKQAFNYGVSRGALSTNPAHNIRARDIGGIEKPRDRILSLEEIKKLWHFLDNEQSKMSLQVHHAIKLILLTGVRTGELRLAQWHEFNFDESLWTIPAEHSKTELVTKVHLSSLVKTLLLELKTNSHSPYVLAGLNENAPLTPKALPRAISRIQSRVGIPHWTAHDLRRTFATQLGETLSIDPVVIEKCLGHKMPKIMATYNKNEMLPQRKEALNQWAQYIYRFVTHSNVISFKNAV